MICSSNRVESNPTMIYLVVRPLLGGFLCLCGSYLIGTFQPAYSILGLVLFASGIAVLASLAAWPSQPISFSDLRRTFFGARDVASPVEFSPRAWRRLGYLLGGIALVFGVVSFPNIQTAGQARTAIFIGGFVSTWGLIALVVGWFGQWLVKSR